MGPFFIPADLLAHAGTIRRAGSTATVKSYSRRFYCSGEPIAVALLSLHHLRVILVSADDHQPVGIHDGDREDALVQAGDERRLVDGPRLAGIGGVEDA